MWPSADSTSVHLYSSLLSAELDVYTPYISDRTSVLLFFLNKCSLWGNRALSGKRWIDYILFLLPVELQVMSIWKTADFFFFFFRRDGHLTGFWISLWVSECLRDSGSVKQWPLLHCVQIFSMCPGWTLCLFPSIWVNPSAPCRALHWFAFQTATLLDWNHLWNTEVWLRGVKRFYVGGISEDSLKNPFSAR